MSNEKPKKPKFWQELTALVAAGSTVKDAAEMLSISPHSAYEVSRLEDFRMAVHELRTSKMNQICGLAVEASAAAIRTLHELLEDSPRSQAVIANGKLRLMAAKAVLGSCLTISENTELRERLDAIETATRERDANGTEK